MITKLVFTGFVLIACAVTVKAQMPNTFSYQGILADAAGTPVADGNYTLTFALYDAANTPTALWTESQIVAVKDGIFNTQIGSLQPLTLAFDKPYFLGISIDGGSELMPRTALTSAPYALVAMRAETAAGLEAGASGVVTSVNTLSGEITLEGGGATTVTRSGNKITISSTGGTGGTGIQGVQNTDGTMSVQNPNGPVATIGLADNGIGGIKLQDGSITESKLAAGSVSKDNIKQNEVVKSLDVNGTTMRDDIVLEAGTNVTLTPSGNKVTISAAGGSGGSGIQGVQNADGTIDVQNPSGPIATVGLADNAVTSAKIAPGQLVTSVKVGSVNMKDAVTLAAGSNVTLSPSGNTVTISAVGGTGGSGIQGVQNTNGTMDILNSTGPIATINVAGNGIRTAHIADDAVTSDKIANGAVTAAKLASGVIPSGLPPIGPAGGSLAGSYPDPGIAADAVRTANLASGAVTSDKIANGAVTAAKLASGLIPSSLPPSGAAGGDLSGSYPNPTIASNSVSMAKLASSAVTTAKLADASVTNAKLANDAVTSGKIDDGTIVAADLANAAVTPAKISGSGASNGQVLSYNGSSVAWATPSSGGVTGSGTANQLAVWSGSGAITGNANLVYSGSKLGVGIGSPSASLHVVGNDGLYAAGTYGSGTTLSPGSGTRIHWYPKKSSFRAGTVSSTQWDDAAIGSYSVAMGRNTTASAAYSTALGYGASATGLESTAMGWNTTASGIASTAVGYNTSASGNYSTASGSGSSALGDYATAMGYNTDANGTYSFAVGNNVTAAGAASVALGTNASTYLYPGAFVFSDQSGPFWGASVGNRMHMRFSSGYYLYTNSTNTAGVRLNPNGSSWVGISDSTKKEGFRKTDGESVLTSFRSFRLGSWNYKDQDPTLNRHYGPMAQEWYAAFGQDGVGTIGDDTTLATADVDGILCIAIQALEKRTAELRNVSADLKAKEKELNTVKERMSTQEEELAGLRTQMQILLSRISDIETALVRNTETVHVSSNPKQVSRLQATK